MSGELERRYEHARKAAQASAALYLLEAAASMLEQLPHIDEALAKQKRRTCEALRKHRNRMLDVMDAEHSKAGAPRPIY